MTVTKIDTKTKIKLSARRLIAERGVEAVTVREIVTAADARNGGSLNYYFGSKEELIAELVKDILRSSGEGWLNQLRKLERAGGAKSVRDIVEVIILGNRNLMLDDPHSTSARFLANVLFTRRRMVRELTGHLDYSVFSSLLNCIKELMPDMPPRVLDQRLIFFAWFLISSMSAYEAALVKPRRSAVWAGYDPLQNMIDAGTGLLTAPIHQA